VLIFWFLPLEHAPDIVPNLAAPGWLEKIRETVGLQVSEGLAGEGAGIKQKLVFQKWIQPYCLFVKSETADVGLWSPRVARAY
jgi:hypothetical protein